MQNIGKFNNRRDNLKYIDLVQVLFSTFTDRDGHRTKKLEFVSSKVRVHLKNAIYETFWSEASS